MKKAFQKKLGKSIRPKAWVRVVETRRNKSIAADIKKSPGIPYTEVSWPRQKGRRHEDN